MNTNHTQLLTDIRNLFEDWKSIFDNPPELAYSLEIDADGIVQLNGASLCPADEINIPDSSYNLEFIRLETHSGVWFTVVITWPYEGAPSITQIKKSELLYSI